MDFSLSTEQKELQSVAREFAQKEMSSVAKTLEEKKEQLSKHPILYEDLQHTTPEWENKTWAELEQHSQAEIMHHLFGINQYQPTPTTS